LQKQALSFSQWQSKDKFGTRALRASNVNRFMMSQDDFFYNGQAKARTFFIFAS
jgi:hypothetical protein